MANVLVCHLGPLYGVGGAQSVCMNVLDTIQNKHNITLLTYPNPKIKQLNDDFDTSVEGMNIISNKFNNTLGNIFGYRFRKLGAGVIVGKIEEEFDLIISTKNVFSIKSNCPSIHYIHSPSSVSKYNSNSYRLFHDKLYKIMHCENQTHKENIYLSNSNWTGEMVADRLESEPTTLYPPVYVRDFNPRSWESRKEGVLTIGRIDKKKNIIRNIKIINELRERGVNLEYSIVGPLPNNSKPNSYLERIRAYVKENEHIHLHGKVSREEISEMISTYKYGLHGRKKEHFGIVIAEYIAGGMIPFVPNSGGQTEIVNNNTGVTYCSREDAVNKLEKVINCEEKQNQLRKEMPDIQKKFGRSRFQEELNNIVEKIIRTQCKDIV